MVDVGLVATHVGYISLSVSKYSAAEVERCFARMCKCYFSRDYVTIKYALPFCLLCAHKVYCRLFDHWTLPSEETSFPCRSKYSHNRYLCICESHAIRRCRLEEFEKVTVKRHKRQIENNIHIEHFEKYFCIRWRFVVLTLLKSFRLLLSKVQ